MTTTTTTRVIAAPVETVFDIVAHIERFREAIPHITDVEFLTDTHRGVGTKFRETRMMGKRKATTELEVTEYALNDHIRIVSDQGGTIWDTVFSVVRSDGQTVLTMRMEARPYKTLARVITPMLKPMIGRAIGKDMDAVKEYCEQATN